MLNSFTPSRLLVTGAAGFIGSHFVEQCVARGCDVLVYDALTYAGKRENLEHIQGPGKYELVVGKIQEAARVLEVLRRHRSEALINFAAESHVDNSIASSSAFIDTNINGTHALLEAARSYYGEQPEQKQAHFRYVQVSTDEVYGALDLEEDRKFHEESLMRPSSPYSASKAAADMLVHAWWKTYHLPVMTTHCSNNYGPRQFPEKLIPVVISRALKGAEIPIYGDGKNIRDWIYVGDHAHGVFQTLTSGKPGETYCFGGHAEVSNLELVETLCRTLDALSPRSDGKSYSTQMRFVKDRPGHDRRYAIDDTKAERELGFKRTHTLHSGLEETVRWYLRNVEWLALAA